jgi:OOP family OmpA-OmpF porin
MKTFLLSLFASLSFYSVQAQTNWSTKLIETTDSYTGEYYSPAAAIGVPCGVVADSFIKNYGGWIMGYNNGNGSDKSVSVKVGFQSAVRAKKVVVVERMNPGMVTEVWVYDQKDKGKRIAKYTASPLNQDYRILNIPIPFDIMVTAVKVVGKPDKGGEWHYIDGIGLSESIENETCMIQMIPDAKLMGVSKPLGDEINTKHTEKYPIISADGKTLYFDRVDDPRNVDGPKDDIWYSKSNGTDNDWSKAKNLGKPLNNSNFNYVSSLTPDINTLILGNRYNTDGTMSGGASRTVKTQNGWSFPENLEIEGFVNYHQHSSYFLAANGKVLVLGIQTDDTEGMMDIYVSFLQDDGKWTKPKNIGNDVNTPFDEATPFLAADMKTMYFASRGYVGYGGYDLYITRRLDDTWTNWSKPLNLGANINSGGGDLGFSVPANGKYAYTYSWRDDSYGSDIYVTELPASIKPDATLLVSGKVYNAKTKQPIGAMIEYEHLEDGLNAGKARSNPEDGSYTIVLPSGKNYGYYAHAEGYIAVHENLDLVSMVDQSSITRDLYLVPIEVGQTIRLNNVFFVQGKAELKVESYSELNRVVEILTDNPKMEIEIQGHTSNEGDPQKNLELSEQRALAVKTYLVSQGIVTSRVKTKGFGQTKPIASNATEETRKLNRRVEFIILK